MRLRQWPGIGFAPIPAMVEAPRRIAPSGAAAHHKDSHGRLAGDAVGRALDPAIEPAPAHGEEIVVQIAVERRPRTELDIAGERERAVAMRPRPEHEPHRAAFRA